MSETQRTRTAAVRYGRWNHLTLEPTRFGRLTVLRHDADKSTAKQAAFICRCDCGQERSVWITSLRSGATQSCGCLSREQVYERTTARNFKHGLSHTPEYRSWSHMVRRCTDPGVDCYANYGGRGITVCPEWLDSFEQFLADMGPRPSLAYTLDRIDNDRGYFPDNCRWAPRAVQLRNRRNNTFVRHAGEVLTLTDWARRLGMPRTTLKAKFDAGLWGARA